jgi:hypothetical protein
MFVTNVHHKVILDGAEFSSPSSDISISSHRTCPLEVEVTRAPAAAIVARRRLRRRHVPRHRRTIGILSLFLSYLWMMSTSATKKRFILDIAKTFLSLWILLNEGYGLGRFLDLVYRINLRASGVRCMKLRMIRG